MIASVKTIFYSLAAFVRKILFSPLENKIHIFAPPCNILYIITGDKYMVYRIYVHAIYRNALLRTCTQLERIHLRVPTYAELPMKRNKFLEVLAKVNF